MKKELNLLLSIFLVIITGFSSYSQNCPDYSNTATGSGAACGGQNYTMTVQNTACNGQIFFDIIGNYGSQYANEITWEVVSSQSGVTVASGGPGFNGQNINITVGPLNPAVHGNVFDLIIYDSFGDGFNGAGGFIQTEQGGTVLANINGNFGAQAHVLFNANIIISPATITINTPSGNVVETVNNCNDFITQVPLNNANFCNTINVNLPWTITCDVTGATLASGNHNVTVYPEVPSAANDLVEITWNTNTCSWDVSPQNDCDALDIGTVFNISPDPSSLATNACGNGNQDFTINYNGLAGSPNCCATAGPLIPITYNDTQNSNDAVAQNSPFGGSNNSAYINFPPNSSGGNATSLDLCFDMTGYCFNPPSFETDQSFFVFVFVDGNQVYQAGPLNGTSHSFCIDLTDIPGGYTQSSDIEIYTLPNLFSAGFPTTYTNFEGNANCGSLADGEWTADFDVTLDVTFDQMVGSPVSCSFDITEPHTCCNMTPTASDPPPINVQCSADVPPPDPTVVTDEASMCATGPTVAFVNDVSDGLSCPETVMRTYSVTDDCGNSIDVEQTITINDTQNPTIGGVAAASNINGCSVADAPAAETTVAGIEALGAAISDNCTSDANLNVSSADASAGTCPIVITRTYTIEDECGNTNTIDHIININDTQDPTVGGAIAASNINGCSVADAPAAETTVTGIEALGAAISDNCTSDANLTVSSADASAGTCPIVVTRTYTIEDECGNTNTIDHIININDTQNPTGNAPADVTVSCMSDVPAVNTANVTGVNDNCTAAPNVTHIGDVNSGGTCPVTITRTYRIEDDCGNSIDVDQIITVNDTQVPTAAGALNTLNENGCTAADASVPVNTVAALEAMGANISDNCTADIDLTVTSVDNAAGTCPVVVTRTYTIEDDCGNTSTIDQIINLNDTQNPSGNAPANVAVPCASDVPAVDINSLTGVADNCTVTPTVTHIGDVSDGNVCAGEQITRTYRVEDDCGNFIEVDQIITINAVDPTFALNGTDPSICGAADGSITISGLDPNTDYDLSYTDDGANVGPITITTDGAGNYTIAGLNSGSYNNFDIALNSCPACSATDNTGVTLTDPSAPTVGAGVDQTVCEGTAVTLTANNPDGANISWNNGVTDGVAFNPGVGTVTYTVTADLAGCISTDQVDVTVNPLPTPTINPVADLCEGAAAVNLVGNPAGGTFSGNGITGTSFDPAAAGAGTHTITYDYTDGNGCNTSTTIDITVNPSTIINVAYTDPSTCGANDGSITISGLDPNTSYNVTYDDDGTTIGPNAMNSDAAGEIVITGLDGGTYTNFIAESLGCASTDNSVLVLVDPSAPTVGAGADQTVCEGTAVTLTANNPDGANISWDNGVTDGVAFNPGVGTVTYTVTADLAGCISTDQVDVTVNPLPTPTINPVADLCESDAAVNLVGNPAGGTFSGNGVAGTNFDPATAGTGTHTITYDYTDGNGCSASTTIDINVISSPTMNVSYTDPSTCGVNDGTIIINGLDPNTNYDITYDDSGNPVGPSTMMSDATGEIIISGLSAGTYSNVLVSTGNGCSTQDNQAFNLVDPNAPAIDAGADQQVCNDGTTVTLTANNPDGANISWDNGVTDGVAFTPASVGTNTYTVTADLAGCISTDQVIVTVFALPNVVANASSINICEGESVTLSGGGATNYNWDNGVTDGVAFVPNATGTYTVTGTDANGCENTDQATVTVNPAPTISFSAPVTNGCVPLTVNFSSNSSVNPASCEWDFGDGSSALACNGVTHEYTTSGCYDVTLTVTDQNGCTNDTTIVDFVCVDQEPYADFSQDFQTVSEPETEVQFTNESLGADYYNWVFYNQATSVEENPSHEFPYEPGAYEVMLVAATTSGCKDTIIKYVIVEEDLIFYVPNTFTPDGDPHNETFKPVMTSGYDPYKYTLLIFNRWGEPLFESHNADIGWDGTYQGQLVQDGTYVWKITIHDPKTDEKKEFFGHVNVLK